MLYNIGKFFFRLVLKTLFRFEVFGLKNIPRKEGFILASNHLSYLDPIVLGVACSKELSFMAKEELFKNHLFGWLLRKVNAFPLRRGSADLSAIKEAMRRLNRGQALLIFPEGARQSDGNQVKPEPGIGFLAGKINVPIIPAFIRGTDKVLPPGAKLIRLKKIAFSDSFKVRFSVVRKVFYTFLCHKKISVYFGKQINVERRMAYQDTALRIMEAIRCLSCSGSN